MKRTLQLGLFSSAEHFGGSSVGWSVAAAWQTGPLVEEPESDISDAREHSPSDPMNEAALAVSRNLTVIIFISVHRDYGSVKWEGANELKLFRTVLL